jgi:bidirectional [NiFe] hydrogenase diaphorase subunit
MTVSITINGKTVAAKEGEYVIEAAGRNGFHIPSLCRHEALSPHGSCRLCLVEIEADGRKRIATSCNYPLRGGEKITTENEKILRLRRMVIELLLPMAPESKVLLALARRHGIGRSRFGAGAERIDCILCGLCVRACRELAGACAIDFSARGSRRLLVTPYREETDDCIACGACAEVCPTETITMEAAAVRKLRERRGEARWCRYHLMGISPGTLCPMNYDCARCEIDQGFRSWYGGHPLIVSAVRKNRLERKP